MGATLMNVPYFDLICCHFSCWTFDLWLLPPCHRCSWCLTWLVGLVGCWLLVGLLDHGMKQRQTHSKGLVLNCQSHWCKTLGRKARNNY